MTPYFFIFPQREKGPGESREFFFRSLLRAALAVCPAAALRRAGQRPQLSVNLARHRQFSGRAGHVWQVHAQRDGALPRRMFVQIWEPQDRGRFAETVALCPCDGAFCLFTGFVPGVVFQWAAGTVRTSPGWYPAALKLLKFSRV